MRYTLALDGLGNTITPQQVIIPVASVGASVGTAAAIGTAVFPGFGTIVGAAAGVIVSLIGSLFQPNLQKIQASNDANQIEPILAQNLANWLSLPPNEKTESVQAAALQVFDNGWAQYQSAVQSDLAKAPNSISDRAEGSCAYHTAKCAGWSNGVYTSNEPNQSTGCCWNWFVGYRDPIANDPNVIPDSIAAAASSNGNDLSSLLSSGSTNSSVLLIGGLLVLGGLILSSTNG